MGKAAKGGDFERELCKQLSKWWTYGSRDDVFWRSSQSGGRATQRAKSGKTTFGSYGDIAAVDPIGQPLMSVFTIELKRGSSYGSPGDLLDFKKDNRKQVWVKCLMQAVRSHQQAKSRWWLLICRRDHRRAIAYFPISFLRMFEHDRRMSILASPTITYRLRIDGYPAELPFVGIPLEHFLERVSPREITKLAENIKP